MLFNDKSRRARVGDFLIKYLKLKTATKTAKGVGKAVKWTAIVKFLKAVGERAPNKRWLALAGGLGTAAVAARKRRAAAIARATSA